MPNLQQIQTYQFDLESNNPPVAVITPIDQEAVVGSIVKLDARASVDPQGSGLTYRWEFLQVPIGSQVERSGFNNIDDDSSIVSFAPDVIGHYQIQLIVNDGTLDSDPALGDVDTRVILVPHHRGLIPDASFIWNYLSDFWNLVDGRKRFETFWSGAIQIVSSEMLKLYQTDYNKSIKDIQTLFQRRWLAYQPELVLDRTLVSFILAEDVAGLDASTSVLDPISGAIKTVQPDYSNGILVPFSEGDFQTTGYGHAVLPGRLLQVGNRGYKLLRANALSKTLKYGFDGTTTAGAHVSPIPFTGSGFTAEMVGAYLKILSGDDAGTYVIVTVGGPGNLTYQKVSSTGVISFPTTLGGAGVTYSILPAEASHSAFFADEATVHTRKSNLPWRFSSTLIVKDTDLEAAGVSVGDKLEVEVKRLDYNLTALIPMQVVSVDRDRLGFVFNVDELTDGTVSRGFADSTQVAAANDLRVPGLLQTAEGNLLYSGEAEVVLDTITTVQFKRSYFETLLTPDSVIDMGAFEVSVRPTRIIRNHKIPVDTKIASIPVLQEYVKQPEVVEKDGALFQVAEEQLYALARAPQVLVENLDYIIDDDASVKGICNLVAGTDSIQIPFGDLLDRGIREGDVITVQIGAATPEFVVQQVLDSDTVLVLPPSVYTATAVSYKITRKVGGKFLRLVKSVYSPKAPAPARLWAEVSYFDNNDAIEANFGVLVGLTQEQLTAQDSSLPYKSAVAGLMYALATGPTVANLQLASQILLGLPFTQNAGVITEINPVYSTLPDGAPLFGRLLVEARDTDGNATGLTNIYFFPLGRQVANIDGSYTPATPDSAGLATNPKTGIPYAVGDEVDQFIILSKGVEVLEYIGTPTWFQRFSDQGDLGAEIAKYHSFSIRVNSDLVPTSDIDLAAQFISRAKPHYAKVISSLLKQVEDSITVVDQLLFAFGTPPKFFDSIGAGLPMAMKFDKGTADDGLITFEGGIYSHYLAGGDLVTTQDNVSVVTVSSPAGGFITARPSLGESHDSPYILPGDVLAILSGANFGRFPVVSVTDDTNLTINIGSTVFQALQAQEFAIYRPIKNPIWTGTGTFVNASQTFLAASGWFSAGVSVGDLFTVRDPGTLAVIYGTYIVKSVNYLTGVIGFNKPFAGPSGGPYNVTVARAVLLGKYFWAEATASPHTATFTSGSPFVVFDPSFSDLAQLGFLRPGDTITNPAFSESFKVLWWDGGNLRAYVTPTPPTTRASQLTRISRDNRPVHPASVDILDHIPDDHMQLTVYRRATGETLPYRPDVDPGTPADGNLNTSAGLPNVTVTVNEDVPGNGFQEDLANPGNYLVIRSGPDATTDVGHGPGIFGIVSVSSSTALIVDFPLTSTQFNILYGIRRSIPNEG